ncbi:MAG: hypothetical protein Q9168_002633 [Polycauliona sp. 1 TL-2023]
MSGEPLLGAARRSLRDAIGFSFDAQQPDGHWVAEVSADVTFTSQYVMFKYAIGFDLSDADAVQQWLLQDQREDGSWSLAPKHPGNVSTSTEAYLALKILGLRAEHPAMLRARDWIIRNGGVAKVRFFTHFFLATFGLVPWSAIPQMPVELIMMPPWSPLNIYTLSSWARSTLIPILIVRHHQPIYSLPNGHSADNDFLDELWVDPTDKNVSFAPPLSTLFKERDAIQFGFTAADKLLSLLGGLKNFPFRKHARRKCIEWLLDHQEEAGDWAGFFPPMHGGVWALILEGYPLDHERIILGMESIERLAIADSRGKRIAPTVSPVWDTALMMSALCDAGVGSDIRVQQAVDWVKVRQLIVPQGDWRIYSPNKQAGGWSFEYHNTFYPDVDDTAVIVIALIKHDPYFIGSECISNAVKWILGMQAPDGGFGAFDYDNNKLWLHKIPFSDMDSLCDPGSADITGRILECFGFLLSHKKGSWDPQLMQQVKASSERSISWLLREQEHMGAWWGRWGNNYTYGTGNVLRGFVHFAHSNSKVRQSVARATQWFESVQNADGGWGEDLLSYTVPELVGRGESTAAQTAWALLSLLPYRSHAHPAVERGIRWLVSNQGTMSENGRSWSTALYTATGFPKVLYLGYPFYHHLFPIMALSKYIEAEEAASFRLITLPRPIIDTLSRSSLLLMVIGSRGDIQVLMNIAKSVVASSGQHVRIATHPCHRDLVEGAGMEFYSVGGNPAEFAKTFTENPNVLRSVVNGDLHDMRNRFWRMVESYWASSFDHGVGIGNEKKPEKPDRRPFLADFVISNTPTLAHVHCAEKLQIPLLLVSIQPTIPTTDFPHVFTLAKPHFRRGSLWNYVSYIVVELVNWLAIGSYLNQLRERSYGMKPVSWTWAVYDAVRMKVPHICVWSPSFLERPVDWDSSVTIAGYTWGREPPFVPPALLERFLETNQPAVAVSFGSASAPDAAKLMGVMFEATALVGVKAVVCLGGSKLGSMQVPSHVYLTDQIPHAWLLPRVHGFIHHGGAGHTAVGLRHGVPALIIPFFLDQNFWAAKINQLRLGPAALDHRTLTSAKLASKLRDLLSPEYQRRSLDMANRIQSEQDGAEVAASTVARLQAAATKETALCDVLPDLKATWKDPESGLGLSGGVAACLVSHSVLKWSDLELAPGTDWAKRRSQASTRTVIIVNRIIDILYNLMSLFYRMLTRVVDPWAKREVAADVSPMDTRDPVRQARIQQAIWDLQYINDHVGELPTEVSIEKQIVANWLVLSKQRFHSKFVDESANGHCP